MDGPSICTGGWVGARGRLSTWRAKGGKGIGISEFSTFATPAFAVGSWAHNFMLNSDVLRARSRVVIFGNRIARHVAAADASIT